MNKRNEQLQTMSFEQLHARSVEFHGHSCPGLIIGIKAAMYVMELFHEVFKAFWDAPLEKAICFSGCAENMHTHFIAERQDRVPDWCCDRLSI